MKVVVTEYKTINGKPYKLELIENIIPDSNHLWAKFYKQVDGAWSEIKSVKAIGSNSGPDKYDRNARATWILIESDQFL